MLVSRPINRFSGCEDVRDEYVAWFDTEKGILLRVSSKRKNAISVNTMKDGYLYISPLKLNGKTKTVLAHRLVCEFFYGESTPERPEVNHKNHIRSDNRATNLEWANRAENCQLDPIWQANTSISREAARDACSVSVSARIDGKTQQYASCGEASKALGYANTGCFTQHLQPLLKGETDSSSFYSRKLHKQVTVKLADHES